MTDLNLKKLESSGDLKVLNRGGIYKYSYGKEKLIADVKGLSGVADGKWFIGNLSSEKGGDSPFSKTHETGVDVDVAIPLKGGESSANDANWDDFPVNSKKAFRRINASSKSKRWKKWATVKERKELLPGGMPDFAKKYTVPFISSGEIDSYKSAQLMKYFVDKGFNRVLLDRSLFNNIAYDFQENLKNSTIKEDDELLQFVKKYIRNNESTKRPLFHFKGHKDHFHFRMEGSGVQGRPGDRKAGEDSDSKEREREREKSKFQLKRRLFPVPPKFTNDFASFNDEGFKEVSKQLYENGDFREWFVDWMYRSLENKFNNSRGISQEIPRDGRKKAYDSIRKYAKSGYDEDNIDDLAFEIVSLFVRFYNGRGRGFFKEWIKNNKFMTTNPMQENKKMKITKERLAQIIKEEVEAYRVSQEPQVNESIDDETLQILKAVVKQTYQELTIPTDVDQTYADTGEPVSKDPEVMKQKAIEFIMAEVEHILDKELEDEVQVDLDEQ